MRVVLMGCGPGRCLAVERCERLRASTGVNPASQLRRGQRGDLSLEALRTQIDFRPATDSDSEFGLAAQKLRQSLTLNLIGGL